MFDKLIDVVLQFIDDILPFVVVEHYNRGVRLRFGKNKGVLEPGFHWKIPFADSILTHMVKTTTMGLFPQTVTTKDGQSVVVCAVVKYEVDNVEQLLLEVNDPVDAVSDMTKGIIRDTLITTNWSECNDPEIVRQIRDKAAREASKWGIKIRAVTLTDLAVMKSLRILNNPLYATT
jgi:regulator of protease activity HflC (stomatin/prohibitin superfamily)